MSLFYKKRFKKTYFIIALLLLKISAIIFARGLLDEVNVLILANSIWESIRRINIRVYAQ